MEGIPKKPHREPSASSGKNQERSFVVSSPTEKMVQEDAKKLLEHFEEARIDMNICGAHFSSLKHDISLVDTLSEKYSGNRTEIRSGDVAQALVLRRLEKGALGSGVSVRAASAYDDYRNGADIVIDAKLMHEPLVGSIDVTINQKVTGSSAYQTSKDVTSARPEGLVKKLERTRSHIDMLADFSQDDARVLLAWVAGGGLSEKQTSQNAKFFNAADKVTLLKYYDAPKGHELHGKPHPVIAGPKVVLSLDSVFINQALSPGYRHEHNNTRLDALITLEIASGIQAYRHYVDSLIKRSGSNALLDQYWITSQAWETIFDRPAQSTALEEATSIAKNDRDVAAQLGHYGKTLSEIFRI